jgi:hypothetical protein
MFRCPNTTRDESESLQEVNLRSLDTSFRVLASGEEEEIAHTAGVTPLVIVPGDELDEVGAKLDPGLGVEDRRGGVADEVGGDEFLLAVLEDALVFTFSSLLDDRLDLIVGGSLLGADNEIDDGDIESGDTEGESAVDKRLDGKISIGQKLFLTSVCR